MKEIQKPIVKVVEIELKDVIAASGESSKLSPNDAENVAEGYSIIWN